MTYVLTMKMGLMGLLREGSCWFVIVGGRRVFSV